VSEQRTDSATNEEDAPMWLEIYRKEFNGPDQKWWDMARVFVDGHEASSRAQAIVELKKLLVSVACSETPEPCKHETPLVLSAAISWCPYCGALGGLERWRLPMPRDLLVVGAEDIRRAEREACARICDEVADGWGRQRSEGRTAEDCAEQIRARSGEPSPRAAPIEDDGPIHTERSKPLATLPLPICPRTVEGRWRVGRHVGRTLYCAERLVGVVDTPELAAELVAAANGERRERAPTINLKDLHERIHQTVYCAMGANLPEAAGELARCLIDLVEDAIEAAGVRPANAQTGGTK